MTVMTSPIASFADRPHHPAVTAGLVTLSWSVAAVLVFAAHLELEPRFAAGAAAAAIAALVATAYVYTRLAARHAGVSHALGVGIAWLLLSVTTELALTSRLGHGWSTLLGSPDRPLLRTVFLFAWIFSPALFARREEDSWNGRR